MNKPFPTFATADAGAATTAFLLAGMHRSGTSALTKVVSILGAELPRTLMRPQDDNPKGFWESAAIANVNDELLTALGSSWDDVLAFLLRREELKHQPQTLAKIRQVVADEFALRGPIVIKEPRIALLLDLWLAALAKDGLRPAIIIPVRDPLEVCGSLSARNGFSVGRSLLLWLSYFLAAEKGSRGVPRVFVRYSDLLEDWRGAMRRVERELGVTFAGWTPAAELEVDAFLSRADRHQVVGPDTLNRRADVADWVKGVYEWAKEASVGEEPNSAKLDRIAAEFEASTRVFAPLIAEQRALISARDARIDALTIDVRDQSIRNFALEGDVQQRDERLQAIKVDLEALEDRAGLQAADIAASNAELERLRALVERQSQTEAALARQVRSLENEVTESRANNAALDERLRRWEADYSTLAERAAFQETEQAALLQQAAQAAEEAANLELEIAALRTRIVELEIESGRLHLDAATKSGQLAAREAQVVALENELRANVEALQERESLLAEMTRAAAEQAELLKEREEQGVVLTQSFSAAQRDIRALNLKVSAQAADLAARDEALAQAQLAEAALRAQLEQATSAQRTRDAEYAAQLEQAAAAQRQRDAEHDAHLRALEASVRAVSERAEAEAGQRRGFESLAAAQKAFIAASQPLLRRVRRALWRRPWLRAFSDGLEFARLSWRSGIGSAARSLRDAHAIRSAGAFDVDYYLNAAWDVDALGQDPIVHYVVAGAEEGRDPSPSFSTATYLARYPDVGLAGANPLAHFLRNGRREGRVATSPPVLAPRPAEASFSPSPAALAPTAPAVDPYSLRPDDGVAEEAARAAAFLERFTLHSENPDWAGAVAALNARGHRDATPEVSIVIPVYGQLAFTLNCLDSLFAHVTKHRFEIIVVDDCSPDASRQWLSRVQGIRFQPRAENGGFIEACHSGAGVARGRWLVFLNNDTRVVAGWLDGLIDSFATLHSAGLVGSKLFYPDGSLQEAGGVIWRDGSAWNYGRNDDPGKPEYCYARPVDYVSGASIALARSTWDQLGGFDRHYKPAYCEDADIALKIRYTLGKEVWVQPQSRVIHYEGKSSGTDLTQGVKAYQVTNTRKMFERWSAQLATHRPNGEAPLLEKDRGVTKRALVIDATTPEPHKDAGSVTCVALMRALQDAGYKVTFAAEDNLLWMPQASAHLQAMGIEVLYAPYVMTLDAALEVHGAAFDLALVFRFGVVSKHLASFREHCPGMPVIMHASDLHFLREERHAQLLGDAARLRAAAETRARELSVIAAVDATIVHSPIERDVVKQGAPDARVYVFPYIQNAETQIPGFHERRDIAYLGGYRHTPNVDAVLYFAEAIWPKIHAARPDMRFIVAGSECPPEVHALDGRDGIVVAGFVEDLKSFFARVRLSVAPIRYGAGIKGKVAVALGHGLPTVLTSCAAEGMGLVDGDAVIIRDDPDEYARELIALYDDEARWNAMSQHALEFVDREYGAKLTQKRIEEVLTLAGVRR